jgi:hypothetical protein
MAGLAAQSGPDLQTRNAQPVMRDLLIEQPQFTPQLASIALRIVLEAAKGLDELVDLHFRAIRQAVDALKPEREGNAKRDGHAGAGADRNPSFGRHEKVALRMKKPAIRKVPEPGGAQKEASDRPAQFVGVCRDGRKLPTQTLRLGVRDLRGDGRDTLNLCRRWLALSDL